MPNFAEPELSALRDLIAEMCPNLALALAEQINSELTLDMDTVTTVPIGDLQQRSDDVLITTVSLTAPLDADSLFIVEQDTACLCFDLLTGNAGTSPPTSLDDVEVTAVSAAFNGMMRGLATALVTRLSIPMEVETCSSNLSPLSLPPGFAMNDKAVQVVLRFTIAELHTSTATFLLTPDWAHALITATGDQAEAAGSRSDTLSEADLAAMLGGIGGIGASSGSASNGSSLAPAPFSAFPPAGNDSAMPRGMELIMDIPLEVTVELGRVKMLIRDVLELASGSIVELDRVAGEPVDLIVNGKLVAKGEVVVIEDNFGIRLTEIVSPADRVAGLGKGR